MSTTTYRYAVDADGTITRGTYTRVGDSDTWSHYWDGDSMIGFYEEYARGRRTLTDNEDSDRALSAYQSAKNHGRDQHEALDTLAVRLTGNEDSRFIVVGLDRGVDLYVLAWGGDSDNTWRNEIEALNNGEVYRIDAEQQVVTLSNGEPMWLSMDSDCTDYYGESNAKEELAKQFPLTEYPAETQVTGSD